MENIVITGLQWGDEGKGKIVDCLSKQADVVVRFQGGNNAGHTINIGKKTFKTSLIPSGIVQGCSLNAIGNGVVIDPFYLLKEIEDLTKLGVTINKSNLLIADNACLILPIHKVIDKIRESNLGLKKIGTTNLGIGPAYEDKIGRRSLRMSDLCLDFSIKKNRNKLLEKINTIYNHHQAYAKPTFDDSKSLCTDLIEISSQVAPYVKPLWLELFKMSEKKAKMIFEGAQGFFLDIDHGSYPYVTSSNTVAIQAGTGSGLSFDAYSLGVTKAYSTRVGFGIFPTELNNQDGLKLAKIGAEFGTVTGRDRRCGWLDLAMLKQAIIISGINGLALTKLDVLDAFNEIKVCTSYLINQEKFSYLPSYIDINDEITPIYKTFKGWQKTTSKIKKQSDLPKEAKDYINFIADYTKTNIDIISVSPRRADTLYNRDFF